MYDERPAKRFVGVEELIFEPHATTEIQRPGIFRSEHVRAAFDEISVAADRLQYAAESIARFEERHLSGRLEFDQPMRGRESGNAAADHGDSAGRFRWGLSSWTACVECR